MINPRSSQIAAYIKSQSRNKIVFYKENMADITPTDIGRELSQTILNFKDESKLPMRVTDELGKILNAANTTHAEFGRIVAISNLGILLERELKQDLNQLFNRYSRNSVLFVQWDGLIDQKNIYFLTKESGIKINIDNLSHIVI